MPSIERVTTGDGGRAGVLVVDDSLPFLSVAREVVRATDRLEVVGEAETGEGAIAAAKQLEPAVVLMDVHMPGIGGINAAEEIKATRPSTLMVLISSTHPDELPPRASGGSIDAVIWKSVLDPRLLDEIWVRHEEGIHP